MSKTLSLLLVFLIFCSCNTHSSQKKADAIARVNEDYLFKEDVAQIVPAGSKKEDSILIVHAFIDRWASQKLLTDGAERNLGKDQKQEFEELVKQYQIDLYTKAYLEEIVKQSVDTIISDQEIKKYYDQYKENFKTNEKLIRLRYINLANENPRYDLIKGKFFDYNKKDKKFWETYSLQSKGFALNDSVWVAMNQIYIKLPFINPDNRDQYISAGKSIQFRDSLYTFMVKIRDVKDKNEISPFEYIRPTLKEVILNQRKLERIKKFKKEMLDDAVKDKNYEIYK